MDCEGPIMEELQFRRRGLRAGGGSATALTVSAAAPTRHRGQRLRSWTSRGRGWKVRWCAAVVAGLVCLGIAALQLRLLRCLPTSVTDSPAVAASTSASAVAALSASTALLPFRPSPPLRRRVLLVSFDIDGPNVNGGIGTANLMMARLLAARHRVTLLHAGGDVSSESRLSFSEWRVLFKKQYGVSLLALSSAPSHRYSSASYEQMRSYELMLWLVQHSASYDIVHIHDWRGLAYYSLLTAQQGHPQLQRLTFVTVCHSQTLWSALGNARPLSTEAALKTDFMERQSIRLSQFVVWPSAYMQRWMTQQQYSFPAPLLLQHPHTAQQHDYSGNLIIMRNPIIVKGSRPAVTVSSEQLPALVVRELVFVGRLEERKGLDLFLDAAAAVEQRISSGALRLQAGPAARLRFTLMGKLSARLSPALHRRVQAVQLLPGWRVLTTYSAADAVAYLCEGAAGRLAVMPSRVDNSPYTVQEALVYGLPFIAANVGGVAELIHDDDRARVTFSPSAEKLTERLSSALADGFVPARPSFDAAQDAADWLDWHDSLPLPVPRRYGSVQPLVSVIMPTYNRTQHVLEALWSLLRQTYDNALLDVVVVNDGTSDVSSLLYYEQVAAFVRLQPRWQYLVVPHGGESLARNAGSELAQGEFLLFMDDDNLAQPSEVDEFVRAAQHTGVDVLTCMAETFSGARPDDDNSNSSYWWMPLGPAVSVSVFHNVVGDSNFFIRASVFRRFGGFAEGVVAEDRELLTRLMLGGARMQLLPHVLLWKRSSDLTRLHILEAVDNRMAVVDAFLGPDVPHDLGVALIMSREWMKGAAQDRLHVTASASGFADRQGWKQWHYEYRTAGDNGQDQQQLVAVRRDGDDGKGVVQWLLPASSSSADCFIRARSQQPCRDNQQPVSVLRSWLANHDCSVVLTGRLWKERTCTRGATRVWIEVDGSSLYEVELRAGETAALPAVEAAARFGHSLYIGARMAASLTGQQEQPDGEQECHEVGVDVGIALKPRPAALW